MQYKLLTGILLLLSFTNSQVLWNEPPDTIWYSNQSRWVEVILPRPEPIKAKTINQDQVQLTIEKYWTDSFTLAYINKFGYAPIPNRYSLYRDGIAIGGIPITDTAYIDNTTIKGETYYYEYLASDNNYISIGGLQHWSPRSYPTFITVGKSQSSLSYPASFNGIYNSSNKSIDLEWDSVADASTYTIFKSKYDNESQQWDYYDYQNITEYIYQDKEIEEYSEYLYSIMSVNGNDHSDRSPPISISTLSFEFGAPDNFSGYFMPSFASIRLNWSKVQGADSYQIFKNFVHPNTGNWQYLTIDIGNTDEYMDTDLLPYQTYFYQILAISGFVKSNRSNTIMVTTGELGIDEINIESFSLNQNIPNPFNPSTLIEYSLPKESFVTLIIYDLMGEKIKTLINDFQTIGKHSIVWDGKNNMDRTVVAGIYFYTIKTREFNRTKKMLLMK